MEIYSKYLLGFEPTTSHSKAERTLNVLTVLIFSFKEHPRLGYFLNIYHITTSYRGILTHG